MNALRPSALSLLIPLLVAAWPAPGLGEDTVRVAASGRYGANRVYQFLLGGGYRELWEAEVELPVLDIAKVGGGLTPTRRFGGLQTAVLGFKGKDGRAYSFRGTDKDPSAVLDPMLRDTVFRSLIQDQMAAQHPGGPIVAGALAEVVGVPHIPERLVVMPDDPALGEFREEFAGMVGTFYEYPLPTKGDRRGFMNAAEIIDYKTMYARLKEDPSHRADVQAFLRARLFDIFLGDFDRHRKQWRWARVPGKDKWQPIPEDRDQAFVRYDGVAQQMGSIFVPILQNYGGDYPSMRGLVLHGWEQDRWLLPELEWADWKAAAEQMQASLTDEAIDEAIRALPPEYVELDGERMRKDLRGRRDRWVDGAREFYEHIAGEVDLRLTDAPETVEVERFRDGSIRVTVTATRTVTASTSERFTLLQRRFIPDDTNDLRLYLAGGADQVRVVGPPSAIALRIVAEGGAKLIDDRAGGGSLVYDSERTATVRTGPGTDVDTDPYVPPPPDAGFVDVEDVPARDWRSETLPTLVLGADRDMGLLIGAGMTHTRYGFRKHPWSSRHELGVAWSTGANRPVVTYRGALRPEDSDLQARLDINISGIEVLRFYGFGNETSRDAPADVDPENQDGFFRVRHSRYRMQPSLYIPLFDEKIRVEAGPWIELSRTDDDSGRLIGRLDPYGSGDFGHVGVFAHVQYDTRGTVEGLKPSLTLPMGSNPAAGYPTSGFLIDLQAKVSPPVWDVAEVWGSLKGSVSGFLGLWDGRFVGAVRIGAKQTFGRVPYFEAASLGGGRLFTGRTTVRGYRAQRFTGDAAVFGNLDLRLYLARIKLLLPGDLGLVAFGDLGRVWEDEPTNGTASSTKWHPSYGGGIWFAPLQRTNTLTLTVASSPEETLLAYFRLGFHY